MFSKFFSMGGFFCLYKLNFGRNNVGVAHEGNRVDVLASWRHVFMRRSKWGGRRRVVSKRNLEFELSHPKTYTKLQFILFLTSHLHNTASFFLLLQKYNKFAKNFKN